MLMNRLRIVTICLKVQEVFSISQVPFGRKDTRRTSQYCLAIYFRKFSSGDVMDQEQVAKLERRAKVAEESIDALRGRLNTLKGIYDNRGSSNDQNEINALTQENESLRNEVKKLKVDLEFLEAQNGVKLVPLPNVTQKAVNAVAESKEEKMDVTPSQPSNDEKTKPSDSETKKGKAKDNKRKDAPKKEVKGKGEEGKPIDASRLDMRIGKIVAVKRHPDADTLYVEEVDLGEGKNRTIVSGLVKHITLEQMQDRLAIFVCNLKPVKMRGVTSEGMIMCASTPEKVEILEPPSGVEIGNRVYCEGFEGEPDTQLNPKRKIWEQVQPDLHVNSESVATYKGGAFTVKGKGVCKAHSMKECPIK